LSLFKIPLLNNSHRPTKKKGRMSRRPFFPSLFAAIIHYLRWIVSLVQSWIRRSTGPIITFSDTGRRVRVGRQIAEGGFSFVFEATDVNTPSRTYALKRITCPDPEILQACRDEAGVHREVRHPNLMPLFGMTVLERYSHCYMLFPYLPHSLRAEVNRRILDPIEITKQAPWPHVTTVLHIFYRILLGVQALHERAHYTHRDIKLENILLEPSHQHMFQPILMDFGSAGPLVEPVDTRRQVLHVVEQASMHTTIPYRPPELFEGGVRTKDDPIDFTKVDVWSLGCTLFGMLYGASPFECEFPRQNADGRIRIVECTQLSVLKSVLPRPPEHSVAAHWYSEDLHDLLVTMLEQDRRKRPGLPQVMELVQGLIEKKGSRVDNTLLSSMEINDDDDEEDADNVNLSLMSNRV
jgi:serine/threonine kinase 16